MYYSGLAHFCRDMMWKMMKADPDWKRVWVDNIAMTLYDELRRKGYKPRLKKEDRDKIAENLLRYLFES